MFSAGEILSQDSKERRVLGVYLFRGSDVKPGLFIISYVKNRMGNLSDKPWKRQLIKQQMSLPALTVSVIQFPLPALALVMQNQVRVQDLPTKNKRTLESHRKSHKVVKCLKCSQYIKSSTFSIHKKQCNIISPCLCYVGSLKGSHSSTLPLQSWGLQEDV